MILVLDIVSLFICQQKISVSHLLITYISRNANVEAENSAEGPKNDKFSLNATTSPKNDVQMLLSQMHDLSFMLKSELSIPSKPDNNGSSHS